MHSTSLLRWLALAAVAVLPGVTALGSVPFPKDDPFYQPPSWNWQSKSPGDILKDRKVQAATIGALKYDLDAYQLQYRSTNPKNQPSWGVTTVLVPHNAKKDHVVTMSAPENSNNLNCAPSYAMRHTGVIEFDNFQPRWEQLLYTLHLQEGWIVNAPDHEGPSSAFADGYIAGRMVLDSMRAVTRYEPLGIPKNAMFIGHGYSGGAISNGWAASLHNVYAPELNVVGWSLGGTPSDEKALLNAIDDGPLAGLVVASMSGLIDGYPEILKDVLLDGHFTDVARKAYETAHKVCNYEMVWRYFGEKIQSSKYMNGPTNFTSYKKVDDLLDTLRMGKYPKYVPKKPVFMIHSAIDEVIPWFMANRTAVDWCNQGANVRFLTETSPDMNHVSTYLENLPYYVMFMRDRFAGKDYYNGGCHFDAKYTSPLMDVSILGERFKETLQAVNTIMGHEVGKKDSILRKKVKDRKNPDKHGLAHIPALKSKKITPGEGGNKSPESKSASAKYKHLKKANKHKQLSSNN